MKKLFILIILFFSTSCFPIENTSKTENISLENKIEELEKRLNEKDNTKEIVQEYKDLNDLYGYGFGILIGLFGFAFPILIYFIQIKPSLDVAKESRALLKKIDEDFEKSFEKHLRKNKDFTIEQAISKIELYNGNSLPTNFTILDTYKDEPFTDVQITKLIRLLNKTELEPGVKEFIADILSHQNNPMVEDYFVSIMEIPDYKRLFGVVQFSKFNHKKHIDKVVKLILSGHSLGNIHEHIKYGSKSFLKKLMNNEKLTLEISEDLMRSFKDYVENYSNDQNDLEIIKSSKVWKKIESNIN